MAVIKIGALGMVALGSHAVAHGTLVDNSEKFGEFSGVAYVYRRAHRHIRGRLRRILRPDST
jgi:hypothetical protein